MKCCQLVFNTYSLLKNTCTLKGCTCLSLSPLGQPTLAINKIVNGKGKTNIEFQGHSHSTQLTTGQTYSIE